MDVSSTSADKDNKQSNSQKLEKLRRLEEQLQQMKELKAKKQQENPATNKHTVADAKRSIADLEQQMKKEHATHESNDTQTPGNNTGNIRAPNPQVRYGPDTSIQPQQEVMPQQEEPKPQLGPLFIGLNRFNDIKGEINALKQSSYELKEVLSQLKTSRDNGKSLLKKSVGAVSDIEKNVDKINNVIKI